MFCVFLRLHCLPNVCILPTSTSSCYSSEIQVSKFGFHGYYCIKPILEGSGHLWLEEAVFPQLPSSDAEWRCPFQPWSLNAEMEFPLLLLCQACKAVKRNHKGLCCDFCNSWLHTSCCAVDDHNYDNLSISSCSWICFDCGLLNFSDSFFDSSVDSRLRRRKHFRFEPRTDSSPITQLVEHRVVMREVVSSSPAGPTLRVLK